MLFPRKDSAQTSTGKSADSAAKSMAAPIPRAASPVPFAEPSALARGSVQPNAPVNVANRTLPTSASPGPSRGSAGKSEASQDGETEAASIAVKTVDFHVRLDIDPALASHARDRFTLRGSGLESTYEQVKTIRDDQVPRDQAVDLVFEGLLPGLRYTLEIEPGDGGAAYRVFEDLAIAEMHLTGARK